MPTIRFPEALYSFQTHRVLMCCWSAPASIPRWVHRPAASGGWARSPPKYAALAAVAVAGVVGVVGAGDVPVRSTRRPPSC